MYLALAAALCLSATSSYALPSFRSLGDSGHICNDAGSSPVIENANHIFNAIHSSMRQWGSSLHHNGMSFFLAQIPAGTELYHGQGDNVTVKGMEWLAFEPEHAMNFARKMHTRTQRPPDEGNPHLAEHGDGRGDPTSRWGDSTHTELRHRQLLGSMDRNYALDDKDKKPLHRRPPHDGVEPDPGWLHTYKMKHDLRLVYIDGEAAAKSMKGTLDTQDYVLAPGNDRDDGGPDRGPGYEYARATQMCNMTAKEWKGRIDGFIRMEHGFELILCDFEKSSDLVRMSRVSRGGGIKGGDAGVSLLSFLQAIGARYHSIGGDRVHLDYDNFVTAFAADIDVFQNDSIDLPRLNQITKPQRERLMDTLTNLVMSEKAASKSTNWQSIADMIIARYSDALHSFAFDTISLKRDLDYSLTLLLRPFIGYDDRNRTLEVSRCATHFIPDFKPHSLAGTATLEVSRQICQTLFSAYNDTTVETSQTRFQNLVDWLQWTSWKECRPGCKYGEFCLTAIWPLGDKESHERPYCVNATSLEDMDGRPGGEDSYWDGPAGPGGPPRHDEETLSRERHQHDA